MCESCVLSGGVAVGSWQVRRMWMGAICLQMLLLHQGHVMLSEKSVLARSASSRGVALISLQCARSCVLFGWQMGYRICNALMCMGLVRLDAMCWWLSLLAIRFTFRFHVVLESVLDVMLLISFHRICCALRCDRYALSLERIVLFMGFRWGFVQSLCSSFHLAAVACSSYSIMSVSHLIHAWLHLLEILRSLHI